jgi:hypothetical protein
MTASLEDTAATAVPGGAEQPLSELAGWWQQSGTLVNDELEIIALEGERVASSLVSLLLYNLLAGLLALSLWFSALGLLVWYLFNLTQSVPLALAWTMLTNLCAFWWLIRRCRFYSALLSFPATRQSLRQLFSPDRDDDHV